MVYSNVTDGEKLTFKYYSSLGDDIINYGEALEFASNENYGNGLSTFGLFRESKFRQPTFYGLGDTYPNPFNPVTSFEYTIPEDGLVKIVVYDINGQMVVELVNQIKPAGYHSIKWNASQFSSGMYFINMVADEHDSSQKLMLI